MSKRIIEQIRKQYSPPSYIAKTKLDNQDMVQLCSDARQCQLVQVNGNGTKHVVSFELLCPLITPWGKLYCLPASVHNGRWGTHYFVFSDYQQLISNNEVELRVDSGCLIGNIFHDITCDCQADLTSFMQSMVNNPQKLLVYIPGQDGRGWGHGIKHATQILMDQNQMDTVTAAQTIHNTTEDNILDIRDYYELVVVLKALLGRRFQRMRFSTPTANLLKLSRLQAAGPKITGSDKPVTKLSALASRNVESKKRKWGLPIVSSL